MTFENYLLILIIIICGIIFLIKQIKNEINEKILRLKYDYIKIIKNPKLSDYEFNKIKNKIKQIDNYLYD
jgi:hypothetical protein